MIMFVRLYHKQKPMYFSLLSIIQKKKKQFCEDYREFLEVTIIFLGETSHRGISFHIPSASHHARWIARQYIAQKYLFFVMNFKCYLINKKHGEMHAFLLFLYM